MSELPAAKQARAESVGLELQAHQAALRSRFVVLSTLMAMDSSMLAVAVAVVAVDSGIGHSSQTAISVVPVAVVELVTSLEPLVQAGQAGMERAEQLVQPGLRLTAVILEARETSLVRSEGLAELPVLAVIPVLPVGMAGRQARQATRLSTQHMAVVLVELPASQSKVSHS